MTRRVSIDSEYGALYTHACLAEKNEEVKTHRVYERVRVYLISSLTSISLRALGIYFSSAVRHYIFICTHNSSLILYSLTLCSADAAKTHICMRKEKIDVVTWRELRSSLLFAYLDTKERRKRYDLAASLIFDSILIPLSRSERMENDIEAPQERRFEWHQTMTTIICFLDVVVIFIAIDFCSLFFFYLHSVTVTENQYWIEH